MCVYIWWDVNRIGIKCNEFDRIIGWDYWIGLFDVWNRFAWEYFSDQVNEAMEFDEKFVNAFIKTLNELLEEEGVE